MKKKSAQTKKDSSILSTKPDLKDIGFIVTKNGVLRPIKNHAKK